MTDEAFIEHTLQQGKRAKEKVKAFSNLSVKQLNWKPSPDSWSVAQCLDHLIISDGTYFSELEKVASGQYQMKFWEKYSPLSGFLGKMMVQQLQEEVKRKMQAPSVFKPSFSEKGADILDQYRNHLDTFLNHISNCRKADLDKTVITSPVTGLITYNLRDAFQFLLQHEHRHLNQATRVMNSHYLPK